MAQVPEDQWIDIDGLEFHCRDWGGTGQPIVLLHGLASTSHIWNQVAPILSESFRVLALDQRRHGQSAKPDTGYDFATVADDLLGLIKARGLSNPIIVGHSWGGDVALEFAVKYPDLARGLGFVDGGMIDASVRHPSLAVAKEEMAPPIFRGVTVDQFRERIRSRHHDPPLTPEFEAAVLANFEVLEDQTIRAWLSRDNHLRIIEALWDHHPYELYPQVQCPVLIMPARRSNDAARARLSSRRRACGT
ncbi:MAG: alpha/beta fold hydrolase, partial [Dehalococcoidia bacterium]